jgi:hypothetical protein
MGSSGAGSAGLGGSAGSTAVAGSAGLGGGAGLNAGAGNGGEAGSDEPPPEVDPAESRKYAWSECGRLPSTPPHAGAEYANDGTLVIDDGAGHLVFHATGDLHVLNQLEKRGTFALTLDGTGLAQASVEGVILQALPSGDVVAELSGGGDACATDKVRFSVTRDRVMTYGDAGLCAWDLASRALVARLTDPILSAAFSTEGIVAALYDKASGGMAVARFDVRGLELSRFALANAEEQAMSPVVSPDGSAIASPTIGNGSEHAALFSAEDGSVLWAQPLGPTGNFEPAFSPAGEHVLIGRGVRRVSDGASAGDEPWTFDVGGASALRLAPGGGEVAALLASHFAVVRAEGLPRHLARHSTPGADLVAYAMRSLAVTPDGATLVSLGPEALRWRLAERFEDSVPSFVAYPPFLSRAELSPDGRWAAFAGDGFSVRSLEGPRKAWDIPPGSDVSCVWLQCRFSPDGQWLVGNGYEHALELFRVTDFDQGVPPEPPTPVWQSAERGCPTLASVPTAYALSIGADGGGASSWPNIDLGPTTEADVMGRSPDVRWPFDDYVIAPNGRDRIRSFGCSLSDAGEPVAPHGYSCETTLSSATWGDGALHDLTAPFPSFSPESHWVVAGPTLIHLPSRETRSLSASTRVALFLPNGDLVAGESDASLVRYCRASE